MNIPAKLLGTPTSCPMMGTPATISRHFLAAKSVARVAWEEWLAQAPGLALYRRVD
jgi:hypothetical protein